jgi:hypothetical protein
MIDGKICNAISENRSTQRCYICDATPKVMTDLTSIFSRKTKTEYFAFGISPLHTKIRTFECLLHIAYNLKFKKGVVRTEEDRQTRASTKEAIQEDFRRKLGLMVDFVKQGFGTTNDGNTARRFFEDPEQTARITGLDARLIRRFAAILQVITSKEQVNVAKFREYAKKITELLFVSDELYQWYPMPPTVHKLMIHGADIIENAVLLIGQLSEEAQEARNKDFKRITEFHFRNNSRTFTNQEIFNNLLISSDPFISDLRKMPNTHQTNGVS